MSNFLYDSVHRGDCVSNDASLLTRSRFPDSHKQVSSSSSSLATMKTFPYFEHGERLHVNCCEPSLKHACESSMDGEMLQERRADLPNL